MKEPIQDVLALFVHSTRLATYPLLYHGASIQADHREENHNEDSYLVIPEKRLAIVFDGVGGLQKGKEIATAAGQQLAKLTASRFFRALNRAKDPEKVAQGLSKIITTTHTALQQNPEFADGESATTLTLVKLWKDKAIFANVGDGRGYLYRNEQLEQVTVDDDIITEIFGDTDQAQRLKAKMNSVQSVSDFDLRPIKFEQEFLFPQKNSSGDIVYEAKAETTEEELFSLRNVVYQSIGRDLQHVQTTIRDVQSGDRIVLLSDGITDNLTTDEIKTILDECQTRSPKDTTATLIAAAKRKSREQRSINNIRSKNDDMTAVIVDVP